MSRSRVIRGVCAVVLSALLITLVIYIWRFKPDLWPWFFAAAGSGLALLCLIFLIIGDEVGRLKGFKFWLAEIDLTPSPIDPRPPVLLSEQIAHDEQAYDQYRAKAEEITKSLTRDDSPPFTLTSDALGSGAIPSGDQFTPSYVLDAQYRIVDWNEAFSILFSNTMDGLRGSLVSEWVFYLENADEVLNKAQDFVDKDALPNPHVEHFVYNSEHFGVVNAKKKAFKIPNAGQNGGDANEDLLGWIAVLDVEFENRVLQDAYSRELINALRWDLVWSEYAICYDTLLMKTSTYPALISSIIGDSGKASVIPEESKVLDLGAGTGNVSLKLAESGRRRVLAVEKNRTSIAILRDKVKELSVSDIENGPGVQVLPQDIRRLKGLPEDFDVVLLNNVLYTIDDPIALLQETHHHLVDGGEIRITGPMKSTDLKQLFAVFRKELVESGDFDDIQNHFDLAYEINRRYLTKVLFRHTVEDIVDMCRQAGFEPLISETVYADQAYLVCARRG